VRRKPVSGSNSSSRRPLAIGIIAFIAGLLIGLIVLGWWIWPVQWTDSYPEYLKSNIRMEYLRMAVDSYTLNQDIDAARQRYAWLGAAGPTLLADAQAAQPKANNAITRLRGVLFFAIAAAVLAFIVYKLARRRGPSPSSTEEPSLTSRAAAERVNLGVASYDEITADVESGLEAAPFAQTPSRTPEDALDDAGLESRSSVALAGLTAAEAVEAVGEAQTEDTIEPEAERLGLSPGTAAPLETESDSGSQARWRGPAILTGDRTSAEGVEKVYSKRLRGAGIRSPEALLERGATSKGRATLAAASGISEALILRWVIHVDFYRIKGIESEYADLLEASGVDTVVELARRNPVNLLEHLIQVNQQKKLVPQPPRLAQVVDWIAQAKSLPRVITY
jgi:hypothetical protein